MSSATLDNFGGAVPPPDSALYPSVASPQNSSFVFYGDFSPFGLKFLTGNVGDNLQRQINVTDKTSGIIGAHQMKFGLDYRRLSPENRFVPYQVNYVFLSLSNVLANTVPQAVIVSRAPAVLIFSKLEPVRSGHLEDHAHVDDHLWPTVGVQCRALIAQWHSSAYRDGCG